VATQAAADTTPVNNAFLQEAYVVYSCDPNDKAADPTSMTPAQGAAGGMIDYLVRFQNVGTAPALCVVITDTLSDLLEVSSLEVVNMSHASTWYVHGGVLHVVFDPTLLPDSTSDEPGSHGAVKFRMSTVSGLAPGTLVSNTANIYFDFNEPVTTNTATCQVLYNVGIIEQTPVHPLIWPDPVTDILMVAANGSGYAVDILNLSGRRVMHSIEQQPVAQLDVSSLAPGQYIVRAGHGAGMRCARFVKQ